MANVEQNLCPKCENGCMHLITIKIKFRNYIFLFQRSQLQRGSQFFLHQQAAQVLKWNSEETCFCWSALQQDCKLLFRWCFSK